MQKQSCVAPGRSMRRHTITNDIKPGDRALFGKYSGSDVVIDGEDYLIMRENEILGILVAAGKAKGAR